MKDHTYAEEIEELNNDCLPQLNERISKLRRAFFAYSSFFIIYSLIIVDTALAKDMDPLLATFIIMLALTMCIVIIIIGFTFKKDWKHYQSLVERRTNRYELLKFCEDKIKGGEK